MDKNMVTVISFTCDPRWSGMPEKLLDWHDWVSERLSEIPEEYRKTAKIEIESRSSWEDSVECNLVVTYNRPETAEETSERLAKQQLYQTSVEAEEKRRLSELMAKYGIKGFYG